MKQLHRLNNVKRRQNYPNCRPKDAASLLIFDLSEPKDPRVLMGRRHPGQEFIPDKFVFPGGRVAPSDSRITIADDLSHDDRAHLLHDMKGQKSDARARAIALAAIRETFEETGVLIGRKCETGKRTRSADWQVFFEADTEPALSRLTFFARAITPPRRPRRYDTRFFMITTDEIAGTLSGTDGEFTETHWMPVANADEFDLHPMTRTILEDAVERIDPVTGEIHNGPIPYYFMQNGVFQRQLINP